ncbi:LysM domain-containing protein [Enterococcus dongliensis]|uniref:LysM domain-containing protein n=1 Tax=Enterococcus dongliensis TaxID=2559925 RepID=A0AAP5KR25_9ENTE|nr:LysM domain-containing protein [Enterococcus dongliensis]MDT2596622.1 LysM domain-containing protein [Enterococcus dongliensis]MDT2603680.1 LysM domain-containing protein [Enterococcus dongliensis]MDT2612634.1 LysM domain-containing protein [Enterococcus dongliensis]MDT2634392.1 LysM domain-containing protein [Enterococcus dongliensis]MDT2637416.1 LysM domain-containing protein [Enterococcus dongliensis]
MKFGKTLVLTTLLTAGAVFALGTNDAHAAENYTVQSGDTLSKISVKFAGDNSLVESIAKENKITNIDMIFEGQNLTIDTEAKGNVTATPVQEQTAVQQTAAPVQETAQAAPAAPAQPVAEQPAAQAATPTSTNSAKEWIAQRESSGSYTATNGQYIGRYQLSASYLNGDYSAANQERVADQYVTSRYGSWEGAQAFWQANGWY